MKIRIAHLTDLHIGPIVGFTPRHWNVKRALGYANWQRKRRNIHLPEVIDRLVGDIREQDPDHWVITGDLVNIGLPAEYERAAQWLQSLGPPEKVSVVPGNHDVYTTLWTDPGSARWQAYMNSDRWGGGHGGGEAEFPFVRRVGEVAVVGVNSAVPTPPGLATGLVGWRQCHRLEGALSALGATAAFRLVMLHHPPLYGLADFRRRLRDAHELEAVLAHAGAELILYGHNHRNKLDWFEGGGKRVPVVGLCSTSSGRSWHGEGLGRYNLYDIERRADVWRIEIIGRGLTDGSDRIVELDRHVLEVDAA
ncbi:MAG: hypothetical protein RLZ98_2943 [Pseudomonadota bacterium]|jgi:3',5'-cyclic AMP phosphodiesterase CpdA